MDSSYPELVKFTLVDIPSKYSYFEFFINEDKKKITEETQVSVKAGEFVGFIYDALIKQYIDLTKEETFKSLSILADLYYPLTMPPELQKTHNKNNIAVMQVYGFDIKNMSEADCVVALMKRYNELTS